MNTISSCSLGFALAGALALTVALPAHAVSIVTVTVGDPGNLNDPAFGSRYGGVSYNYAIGKYEVTLNQYTEFLNAVAATDTYGLYNVSMGMDLNIKGITRSGSPGSYTYAVNGDGNRPVTYVSWFDAARFTNWLHNGQPTGLQTAATTEDGAYTLNGAVSGIIRKNAGAQDWIPSENEWYKAAYYQPAAAGGDADGYWLYPTRSNAIPNSRNGSVSDPNSGNFYREDGIPNGYNGGYAVTNANTSTSTQNYLTPVGAFTLAPSYYGTFDQGGNVREWDDGIYENGATPTRLLRGGAWLLGTTEMRASDGYSTFPTEEYSFAGFRIATAPSAPEPSAALLLLAGAGVLLRRRRG